jgi:glycosyltransferase involved in cell wall biosynthesis
MAKPDQAQQVVMLLENNPYPQDTRVRNEAESLSEAGVRVTVLAPRGAGQSSRQWINGVEVRRYRMLWAHGSAPSYAAEYAVAHLQLLTRAALALARGARVLHFHGPPDTLFAGAILARAAGRDVVFDLHDSGPELFQAKFGSSAPVSWALRAAQRQAINWASHVIVTNESQRQLVRERGRRAEDEVSVVRNGPRAREFSEQRPPRAGSLASPRLIYVGALDTQDGVLELADLLALQALANATLTIVGDGPVCGQLRARCEQLGVAERVIFSGLVPHAEVPRLIAEADIGLDPAPGSELNHGSTMIKVLEYMGAGRPLVAYELRETRRSAGEAALYAPCGDLEAFAACVARLAREDALRLRMAALARSRAGELAWDRQAQVLQAVYQRLLSDEVPTLQPLAAELRKYSPPSAVSRS